MIHFKPSNKACACESRKCKKVLKCKSERPQIGNLFQNKNARRPKEAHNARIMKEIKIVDRAGEDLKELDQH